MVARRIRGDWLARYGFAPVLLETFVELPTYYDQEGTIGYNYRVHDAKQLCDTLANALSTTELHVQSSGLVVVYLDVETGLNPLKSAYWAGWANTVHTYQLSGTTTKRFFPEFTADTRLREENMWLLRISRPCSTMPTNIGRIRMEPELCSYCTSGADVSADWSQFATAKRMLQTGPSK